MRRSLIGLLAAAAMLPGLAGQSPAHADTTADRVDRIMSRMTLAEKIGQLFVVSFNGTAATAATAANAAANRAEIGTETIAEAFDEMSAFVEKMKAER